MIVERHESHNERLELDTIEVLEISDVTEELNHVPSCRKQEQPW